MKDSAIMEPRSSPFSTQSDDGAYELLKRDQATDKMTSELMPKSPSQAGFPLYGQIAATLRRRIETNFWAPGSRISTIEELQSEFGVARVTIRQAVELLEREGLLRRQQGKGTFVSDNIEGRRWLEVATTWQSQLNTIDGVVHDFLQPINPPAQPRIAPHEGRLADNYIFLRSVQSRNGAPYAIVNLHLAKSIYDRDRRAFRRRAAMAVLITMPGIRIDRAHQTLVIGRADAEAARLLRLTPDAPTGEARWVITDKKGVAVYVADITYRGDLIRLEVDLASPGKIS